MNNPNPTFTTRRLAVFQQNIVISDILCAPRMVFVAFPREVDRPRIVCTMLIEEVCGELYVDWISTDEDFRRQGYAEELWRAVETHLGRDLIADGASEAGEKLCEKMAGAADTALVTPQTVRDAGMDLARVAKEQLTAMNRQIAAQIR